VAENPTPIELQKYLKGVDYPASKTELLERAKSNGAPDDVLSALQSASQDSFDAPTDVSSAISGA
jgi:hypothetical protein